LIDGKYLGDVANASDGVSRRSCDWQWAGTNEGTIWIHAVSVGEVLAAYPLAKQ